MVSSTEFPYSRYRNFKTNFLRLVNLMTARTVTFKLRKLQLKKIKYAFLYSLYAKFKKNPTSCFFIAIGKHDFLKFF